MTARWIFATFLLALAWTTGCQDDGRSAVQLRESSLFKGDVTFRTGARERTLSIELKQFQLDGNANVSVPLPETGLALFQHRAGEIALSAAGTRFEPLEGEWMTIDLPEKVVLATEDDAALVDAIIISE